MLFLLVLYIEKGWIYINNFNYVNSIASSPRYVYFGTDNGIIIFDKLKEEWKIPEIKKLFPKNIKLIAYDNYENCVWVVSQSKIYKYAYEDYREVIEIIEAPHSIGISSENIYLLYKDKKCIEINKLTFLYKKIDSIPKNIEWSPKSFPNNYVWLSPYYVEDKFFNKYKMSCVCEDGGTIWVGTYGYGVFRYNVITRVPKHYFLGFPSNSIPLYEKNFIWIASSKGIYKWYLSSGIGTIQYKEMPHHFYSEVSALLDYGNKLLIGTADGLLEYDISLDRWDKIYAAPKKITSLCIYHDTLWQDKILIGTENSLVELKGNECKELLKNVYINDVKIYKDKIWIATPTGVFFYNQGEWFEFTDPNKSLSFGVNKIEFSQDKIYFCSNQGLLVYSPDKELSGWKKFNSPVYLPSDKVISLAIDSPYIWIGTDYGVSKWNTKKDYFKLYTKENSPINSAVYSILFDKKYVFFVMREGIAGLKK